MFKCSWSPLADIASYCRFCQPVEYVRDYWVVSTFEYLFPVALSFIQLVVLFFRLKLDALFLSTNSIEVFAEQIYQVCDKLWCVLLAGASEFIDFLAESFFELVRWGFDVFADPHLLYETRVSLGKLSLGAIKALAIKVSHMMIEKEILRYWFDEGETLETCVHEARIS